MLVSQPRKSRLKHLPFRHRHHHQHPVTSPTPTSSSPSPRTTSPGPKGPHHHHQHARVTRHLSKMLSYVASGIGSPFEMRKVGKKRKSLTLFREVDLTEKLLKGALILLNIFWLVIGITFVVISFSIFSLPVKYNIPIGLIVKGLDLNLVTCLVFASGLIITFTSIAGALSAGCEMVSGLVPYFFSTLVSILVIFVSFIYLTTFMTGLWSRTREEFDYAMQNFVYDYDLALAIQQIQYHFACCGYNDPSEWDSRKMNIPAGEYPLSCCGWPVSHEIPLSVMSLCKATKLYNRKGCLQSPILHGYFNITKSLAIAQIIMNILQAVLSGQLIAKLWHW